MKNIGLILLLLLTISCSSDDDSLPQNSSPQELKLESVNFDGKKVTIDWNDVKDADNDNIYYSLYINSILVEETIKSISTSFLEYNNEYVGRIIATDKKGGVSELEFTFNSPQSKILFFADSAGNLTAYDLITDQILWESENSFVEAHTADQNVIFTGQNGINAHDILTGEILWTSTPSINYNKQYRNIITDKTNIYAFDADSNLHCITADGKTKLWERSFLRYYASLAIGESKIYVSSTNDDNLYALNKDSGTTDWSFRIDSRGTSGETKIETNPLIVENNIYFGDNKGRFYSFNNNNGALAWTLELAESVISPGFYDKFYASPTIYKNTIIAATYNTLYGIDKENGTIKWKHDRSIGNIESSPFVYYDQIYFGFSNNGSGGLVCLSANDGRMNWTYSLPHNTTTSPIVFEDTVYIGDWDKNFHAVNASTGALKWMLKTKAFIIRSPTIVLGNSDTVIYPSSHGLKN